MRLLKSIVISLILFFIITSLCQGASLNLAWNPNGEGDLAGYYVYYGTSPGSYGNPIDVENVTEYELSGLDAGVRYYVAITAYDTSDNESEKSDEESGVPADTQDPTVTITVPTASSTYSTEASVISIAGSADDNVGVTEVSWVNDRGSSGSTSGTTDWSISGITLQEGENIITVSSHDAAGNTGSDTITVTYSPDLTILHYNSTDPVLILTGSVPEEGSISINVPDNLDTIISSTLLLTLWDADLAGEGFIYVNNNQAIDLPVGPYNNLEHDFEIPIDPGHIITGNNIIRFTHVTTAGYEVRSAALKITYTSYQDNADPEIIITSPTQSPTYTTSNSTIVIGGYASDNLGVVQVSWVNDRGSSGTASGTADWSISGIALQSGDNTITVTGRDAADNTGTDSIIINYTPPTSSTTSSVISTTTTSVASTTTTVPTTTTSAASTTTTAPTTTTSAASTTTTVPTSTTSVVSTTTTSAGTTTTPTTIPAGTTTIPATTTVPPGENPISGSIIINNGEPVIDSPEVTLTLFATVNRPVPATTSPILAGEELGPDAVMCVSNDGQQWSPIEPYRQTKQWTLEPGDGVKTVYAQFSEGDGKWMVESAQAQVTLETDEVSQSACVEPQKIQPLSVTASSASPRNPAYKLIDGDPSTVWSSTISLFKKNQSITLDLGATKKISGLTMYASQLFGVDFFPTSFTIQASQDGATWVDISSEQGYVFGLSLSSGNWETNGLESRYIRIHITKSKTLFLLFKLAQIGEIEVYGCNTAGEIPILAGEKLPGAGSEQQQISTPSTSANKTQNSNMALSAPGKPAVKFLK